MNEQKGEGRVTIRDNAHQVLQIEVEAIQQLTERIDDAFEAAVQMIYNSHGRIILTGVGKSGHIARKIAATLASTGTQAYFMHAAEGSHGDLGMIHPDDILLILSYSGEVQEILALLPSVRRIGAKVIAMTGRLQSTLAREADVVLNTVVNCEACPHNLAPTASTTAMLVMGDMLAITLLKMRGFSEEDYALYHPGGTLGRRLLLRVSELMHGGDANPIVRLGCPMSELLVTLSEKALGAVNVVDDQGCLVGLFTDGDLKRCLRHYGQDVFACIVDEVMTRGPVSIPADALAARAVTVMENRPSQISVLPVVDDLGHAVGLLRLHDLVRAGIA